MVYLATGERRGRLPSCQANSARRTRLPSEPVHAGDDCQIDQYRLRNLPSEPGQSAAGANNVAVSHRLHVALPSLRAQKFF